MSRGYIEAGRTYVRWLFLFPLAVTGLMFLIVMGDRASSLPLWSGAVAWGMALGLHWKEYLARPEALLCPAMRRGQIGMGLGLSMIFLLGNSWLGVLTGGEWWSAVLSLQLTGFLLGLGVSHFVRIWMSFAGFVPMISLFVSRNSGRMFFADWMLGESLWPSLFAAGASACGVVLILDRYFTMREESVDYWQPLVTWKGLREYQLQKSKGRGGDERKRWKLWGWMEERRYRWLMGLSVGVATERRERRRLRYLASNFRLIWFSMVIFYLFACGWGFDQFYQGRNQLNESVRVSTWMMIFAMSLMFCLMPLHGVAMGEKFRTSEMMRPLSRRTLSRELVEDALLASASLWSLPAGWMLIVGWLWPEKVFWGEAPLLTALVLAGCFLFVFGLLLYLIFAFEQSQTGFYLAFGAMSALITPFIIFWQVDMLSSARSGFLVLISLGGMAIGCVFIQGAYRRLCEMDIG